MWRLYIRGHWNTSNGVENHVPVGQIRDYMEWKSFSLGRSTIEFGKQIAEVDFALATVTAIIIMT